MARPSYRRRPDGIVEIVRPKPWERLGLSLRSSVAALVLLVVGVAGVALHSRYGIPVLMVAASCVIAARLFRSHRERRRAPAPASAPRRALARPS